MHFPKQRYAHRTALLAVVLLWVWPVVVMAQGAVAPAPAAQALPAQSMQPAPATQPVPVVGAPTAAAPLGTLAPPGVDWNSDFIRAKTSFIEGRFELATKQFENLLARAQNPVDRARVEELLQATQEWTRRGVTLIAQSELAGTDLLSRRTDRRTADEIGVLYLSSIVYGLGTGGWVDVLSEPHSAAGAILPPLLLAGASVGAVALIDSGKGLRYGSAQSISTGMTLGFYQGFAWTTYYQATSSHSDQMDAKNYVTLLWATTTAGALAGGVIGSVSSATPGRAAFVGSATLWPAVVFGFGAAGLSSDDRYRDDHALLATAFGATAGMVGGILTAGPVSPTTARVRFLDLGAIGGGLAVGGLTLAARAESTKDGSEIFLATDLGILAGLGLAWWLTSNMPQDLGAEKPQPPKATVTPTLLPQRGGIGLGALGTF
jgi:hypothetical protein